MIVGYFVGAALSAAMIVRANRVTGQNYAYLTVATLAWPAWLALYGLSDTH